jgi:hypothetical protein
VEFFLPGTERKSFRNMLVFANEASTGRRFGRGRSFHGGDLGEFVMREYYWSFRYCMVCFEGDS